MEWDTSQDIDMRVSDVQRCRQVIHSANEWNLRGRCAVWISLRDTLRWCRYSRREEIWSRQLGGSRVVLYDEIRSLYSGQMADSILICMRRDRHSKKHTTPHHTVKYRTTLHRTTSRHTTSHNITSRHTKRHKSAHNSTPHHFTSQELDHTVLDLNGSNGMGWDGIQ